MTNIILKAKQFAVKAHGDQKYGDFPYEKHLQDVVDILNTYFLTKADSDGIKDVYSILAAAWLHDTLEDTKITFKEMYEEFGPRVVRIAFACSDEPGKNRKEKHERTYPKLMAAGREAIAVKLADRIANVRHSLKYNHSMFKMYRREYEEFKKALHLPVELKELWATLDVLMATGIED